MSRAWRSLNAHAMEMEHEVAQGSLFFSHGASLAMGHQSARTPRAGHRWHGQMLGRRHSRDLRGGVARLLVERRRLEQMKADFINRAGHELRTPLATIGLVAGILEEGGTPMELAEYWRILNEELERQRVLVENLLVFARMDAGLFEIGRVPVDMGEVTRGARRTAVPLAAAKSITLSSFVAPDLPLVLGDRDYLQQVVLHLLTNAVKFTPANGRVTLRVEGRGSVVVAQVIDTGLGIPPEDMPHLFQRFFRASNAIEQEIQGTGMGLYMVKAIMEQLGGRVRIESSLGQGTSVTVWLPTDRAS